MESSKHQGWANYPTWAVNLWLSNDEGLYNETSELLAGRIADSEAADALEGFVESLSEVESVTEHASFVSDLLGYALGEVDWFEIAKAWIEDRS